MLLIEKEDLDSSLNDIRIEFNLEERLLTLADMYDLNQLKNELVSNISKTTDLEEQKIHFNRIDKIDSILAIHEYRLRQVFEYLKKPLIEIPEYSDKKLELEKIDFRLRGSSLQSDSLRGYLLTVSFVHNVPVSSKLEENLLYANIDYFERVLSPIYRYVDGYEVYEGMYRFNRLVKSIDWVYYKETDNLEGDENYE